MRRVLHCPLAPWRVRPKCHHSSHVSRVFPRNSSRSVSHTSAPVAPINISHSHDVATPSELYMRDLPDICIDWSSNGAFFSKILYQLFFLFFHLQFYLECACISSFPFFFQRVENYSKKQCVWVDSNVFFHLLLNSQLRLNQLFVDSEL